MREGSLKVLVSTASTEDVKRIFLIVFLNKGIAAAIGTFEAKLLMDSDEPGKPISSGESGEPILSGEPISPRVAGLISVFKFGSRPQYVVVEEFSGEILLYPDEEFPGDNIDKVLPDKVLPDEVLLADFKGGKFAIWGAEEILVKLENFVDGLAVDPSFNTVSFKSG